MATFDRKGRVALPVQLPQRVYKALKEFAYLVDDSRSMNSVIIQALTAYLADENQIARLAAARTEAAQRRRWWWSRQHPGGQAQPRAADAHPSTADSPFGQTSLPKAATAGIVNVRGDGGGI
jgi:hypothetical protein